MQHSAIEFDSVGVYPWPSANGEVATRYRIATFFGGREFGDGEWLHGIGV